MEFWKWYFKGLLKIPRAFITPWGEYAWGCILGITASMLLSLIISPLWLLLTLPAGATIAAHGMWRGRSR